MRYVVEQQAKTGLGGLHWVRVAGPFGSPFEADRVKTRLEGRGLPVRTSTIGIAEQPPVQP